MDMLLSASPRVGLGLAAAGAPLIIALRQFLCVVVEQVPNSTIPRILRNFRDIFWYQSCAVFAQPLNIVITFNDIRMQQLPGVCDVTGAQCTCP